MSFTTVTFLFCFLPFALILYYACPAIHKQKMMILLSILFYAWGEPMYVFGLLGIMIYCYLFGEWINHEAEPARRNLRCRIACSFLVFLFVYFKYYEAFLHAIMNWMNKELEILPIIMPLGLSFVLFQALSYLIDIKRCLASSHQPWMCACYITFFPKLLMGPIMPYHAFVKENHSIRINSEQLELGSKQVVLGLSQKLILADTFAQLHVQLLTDTSMLGSWLSSLAYTIQIFFDFAGYSLIAIGLAHLFGYELMENFHQPYLATSIKEFWRRWHISLSHWFRDYVYIPLGGNRRGTLRHIRNLLIVWILTGLWHGSTLNFLIWGLYYGCLIIIETFLLPKFNDHVPAIVAHLMTFLLINIGWVIFANQDMLEVISQLKAMIGLGSGLVSVESVYNLRNYAGFFLIAIGCVFMPVLTSSTHKLAQRFKTLEPICYAILFICAICFLLANGFQGFLYTQF